MNRLMTMFNAVGGDLNNTSLFKDLLNLGEGIMSMGFGRSMSVTHNPQSASAVNLPIEIILKILSRCDNKTLKSCLEVNKSFKKYAKFQVYNDHKIALYFINGHPSNIKNISPKLLSDKEFLWTLMEQTPGVLAKVPDEWKNNPKIMMSLVNAFAFGKEKWESSFGLVGSAPELPADIVDILLSDDPYDVEEPRKKVIETHVLLLMPKTVNGIDFNLKSFQGLVKNPISGNKINYHFMSAEISNAYATKTPEDSHWILMKKNVIPGSGNKTYTEQKNLVIQKDHYVVPDIFSATVGILTNYVRTGECLFSSNSLTSCSYTNAENRMILGRFTSEGLMRFNDSEDNAVDVDIGITALRKL